MSISGILSSSFLQKQLGAPSTPYQLSIEQLSKDLQSGNLAAARSEFSSLQKAFAQPATRAAATSTASISSVVAQAFNQLATDLKSGNLSAAQKDFSILQQDLENLGGPGSTGSQHHHSLGNSLQQNLTQFGQNLASGNLFAAVQQAYANLREQAPASTVFGKYQTEPPVSGPPSSTGGLPISVLA
jgi:hypothetical protein